VTGTLASLERADALGVSSELSLRSSVRTQPPAASIAAASVDPSAPLSVVVASPGVASAAPSAPASTVASAGPASIGPASGLDPESRPLPPASRENPASRPEPLEPEPDPDAVPVEAPEADPDDLPEETPEDAPAEAPLPPVPATHAPLAHVSPMSVQSRHAPELPQAVSRVPSHCPDGVQQPLGQGRSAPHMTPMPEEPVPVPPAELEPLEGASGVKNELLPAPSAEPSSPWSFDEPPHAQSTPSVAPSAMRPSRATLTR